MTLRPPPYNIRVLLPPYSPSPLESGKGVRNPYTSVEPLRLVGHWTDDNVVRRKGGHRSRIETEKKPMEVGKGSLDVFGTVSAYQDYPRLGDTETDGHFPLDVTSRTAWGVPQHILGPLPH